jgi:glyoxylase I family protein
VSFAVTDVARSVDFYVGVFGCRQLHRPEMGFRGAWLQLGAQQIHLMQRRPGDATTSGVGGAPDGRNNHIAISVDDLASVRRYLSVRGVPFVPGPGTVDQVFLNDPDGNTLELTAIPAIEVWDDYYQT